MDEDLKKVYVGGLIFLIAAFLFFIFVINDIPTNGFNMANQIVSGFGFICTILGIGSLKWPRSVGMVALKWLENLSEERQSREEYHQKQYKPRNSPQSLTKRGDINIYYGQKEKTKSNYNEEPSIKVSALPGVVQSGKDISDTQLFFKAANSGRRPVTLVAAGLDFVGGEQMLFVENIALPVRLEDGQAHTVIRDLEKLRSDLGGRKIAGLWFKDQVGRKYRGDAKGISGVLKENF